MSRIINLDEVIGAPKEVKLGGHVYKVPADIPIELYLKINSFDGEETEQDVIESIYDDLLELFRVHQPDLESLPLSITQVVKAIPLIYAAEESSKDDASPNPPRAARRGKGATTRVSKPTRSRS